MIATSSLARPRYGPFVTPNLAYELNSRLCQIEDMNSQSQLSAAQQLAQAGGGGVPGFDNSGLGGNGDDDDDDDMPDLEAPEEEGDIDESGIDPKDIELVVTQVGCSRAKAVRVLKESDGDLINASTFIPSPLCCSVILLESIFSSHEGERVILILDFLAPF